MENKLENKEKFFAQYWSRNRIAKETVYKDSPLISVQSPLSLSTVDDYHLEIKPLSQITDEDAIEVAKLIGYFFDKVVRTGTYIFVTDKYNDFENQLETLRIYNNGEVFYLDEKGKVCEFSMEQAEEVISFLRSKGIAYQYSGLSVEQQIEFGWIKLKTID